MKILLVRPPATYVSDSFTPSASIPVGLLYIAAILEQHGHTVEIYDAQVNPVQPVFEEEGHLHMGDPWEVVELEVARRMPALVGITSSFSAQFNNTIRCVEIVRRLLPEAVVIVGGNHPTVRPADFLKRKGLIDLVCMGEGEYTMLEVADRLLNSEAISAISGTALLEGDSIRTNSRREAINRLDELPFPAYHLLDLEKYFALQKLGFVDRIVKRYPGSERAISVITSRGCPFNCIFCSIHLHMGRKWRAHSVDYVKKHLELLSDKYGVKHIHFEDDNISANPERFRGILRCLREADSPLTWDTPNGVRVDTLSFDIVKECKQSGCVYLVYGVESGNQRVLDTIINKRLNLDDVEQAAGWSSQAGLDSMAFYVIGFPGETRQDMDETVNFALRLQREYDVLPNLFVATPLPGTKLEEICIDRGLLPGPLAPADFACMTQGAFAMNGGSFSADDVRNVLTRFRCETKTIFVRNGIRFFLRNPAAIVLFVREVMLLKLHLPLKKAVYRVLEFKNCLRRGE